MLTIGAEDDWAPYSSVPTGGGAPRGFAVTLVGEAFATQGRKVRFVGMPFARCMFLARTGEIHGCFNATIVDDNRDDYYWHPTPMFSEELAIFAPPGEPRRDLGLKELEGHRVGYTLGYTYPTAFRGNPRIHKVSAKSDRVLIELLLARRVDYVLLNSAPAYLRMKLTGRAADGFVKAGVLSVDGFWVAFTRKHPEGEALAQQFESGLAELQASGRQQAMAAALRQQIGQPGTGP